MTLICFATLEEAQSSIEQFSAQPIRPGLYTSQRALIAITGIGPFAAHIVSLALSDGITKLINIGLAGSPRGHAIGTIHPISIVTKYLWHPHGQEAATKSAATALAPIHLQSEGLTLTTLDFPLHNTTLDTDLVDMEGYAIALTAKQKCLDCHLYKIISDHCTPKSVSQIKSLLPTLSKQMAIFLAQM